MRNKRLKDKNSEFKKILGLNIVFVLDYSKCHLIEINLLILKIEKQMDRAYVNLLF